MLAVILILCSVSICNVSTMYSSKDIEGYPSGYLADCPGSNKEAIITKKSLKYLSITVKSGHSFLSKNRKYSYYQMKELAMDPNIDFRKKTLLYVGGFLDSPSFPLAINLDSIYKELGYNVLLLDTNFFTTMEYPRAARLMRAVGKNTAKMLADLTQFGLDPKKLEIVGISLGSQTASFIAKKYRQLTGNTISRLTGLDPAGPCFRNLGPEDRIDKSDADFVEIIATNIDGWGMAAPVGHINVYVNGGEYQPASDILWPLCNVVCSHLRSYFIWLSVLKHPDSFIAIQCDSVQEARERKCYDRRPTTTTVLGLNCDKSKEGIFYLNTNNKYPYYMGEKGLLKEYDFTLSHTKVVNDETVLKI